MGVDQDKHPKIIDLSSSVQGRSFMTHWKRGIYFREQGDLENAIKELLQAYELQPDKVELCLDLGTCYGEEDDFEEAVFYFKHALQIEDDNPEIYFYLGLAYLQSGHPHHAVNYLLKSNEYNQGHPQVLLTLAEAFRACKDKESAMAVLESVLLIQPTNLDAINLLAVLLLEDGELQDARRLLRQALRIDPRNVQAHINLGVVCLQSGFMDAAVREFDRATQLDPQHARAWFNLGHCLVLIGDVERSLEALDHAAQLSDEAVQGYAGADPQSDTVKRWRDLGRDSRLLSASQLIGAKRYEEARAVLDRILAEEPNNPDAHGYLGQLLLEQRELKEAREHLRFACSVSSYVPGWSYLMAMLECAEHHYGRALSRIKKALQLNDMDSRFWELKAEIHRVRGEDSLCEEAMARAEQLAARPIRDEALEEADDSSSDGEEPE